MIPSSDADTGGVVSTRNPDSGVPASPGYDITAPTPGQPGMSVAEARTAIASALDQQRAIQGLTPLDFVPLTQAITEDEAIILGQEVIRLGRHGMRTPNTNNWVANYPALGQQPWWSDTTPPVAWVWKSSDESAPLDVVKHLGVSTSKYQHAGVGVWRDPASGTWFFVLAFFR